MRVSQLHRRITATAAAVVLLPATFALMPVASASAATTTCDLVASPTGNDSNPGTIESPMATASALVGSLGEGQTGCLRAGRYSEDEIKIETPGVTLTSYPGEVATLRGRLWVADAAPGATVSDLSLDGRNSRGLPSPTINGDHVTLTGNDITNHGSAICVSVGSPDTWGRAQDTLIEDNRVHDCGSTPPTNYDHGIYVSAADGTVIRHNLIYDNADRGIQLYPDAQDSLVTGNVIDGNGEGIIFGGDDSTAASGNVVEHNVITNSRERDNIESNWSGPVGQGNVARYNCVGGGAYDDGDGGILGPQDTQNMGFRSVDNTVITPEYADPANGDYTVPASNPCAAWVNGEGTTAPDPVAPTVGSVTIQINTSHVDPMAPVHVTGKAKGATRVLLVVHRNGSWHRIASEKTRGNGSYRATVRLGRAGRETLKARARGLRDSKRVKIHVKRHHRN
jgi:hypothetical protein